MHNTCLIQSQISGTDSRHNTRPQEPFRNKILKEGSSDITPVYWPKTLNEPKLKIKSEKFTTTNVQCKITYI